MIGEGEGKRMRNGVEGEGIGERDVRREEEGASEGEEWEKGEGNRRLK